MKALLALSAALSATILLGFDHRNTAWPSGEVPVHLQLHLDAPAVSFPLADRSASWNAAIAGAVTEWNRHLGRTQLRAVTQSDAAVAEYNGINNAIWSDDVLGEYFDDRTLALTILSLSADSAGLTRFGEADIVFNRSKSWNAYNGLLRYDSYDIRRVFLHELGHLLGLDHPDEAIPVQDVNAVMNSTTGNVYLPQADDIAGVTDLYGTPLGPLSITRGPSAQSVPVGGRIRLEWDLNGAPAPAPTAVQRYVWYFQPTGGDWEFLFTLDDPVFNTGAAQIDDSGSYMVVAEHPDATVASEPVEVTVTPVTKSTQTRLANLSTRGIAGVGEQSMIVGFVVSGSAEKAVLVRAIGPALRASFNLPGALTDPALKLYRQESGQSTLVASNDDWGDGSAAERAELEAVSSRVGAFALADAREAVLHVRLAPGVYSAVVESTTGERGVALVEAYDADPAGARVSRLGNLSTRGYVGRGADVLIGGLSVAGPAARTYLIRAVGDTLKAFNLSGTLDDPVLAIYSADQVLLRERDDWDSPAQQQASMTATMEAAGAFPLSDRQESALRLTLAPGNYSLHVRGWRDSEGIALLEVYELTGPDGAL